MTADSSHLVGRRGLSMPEEDREALAQYWTRLQKVRADIDKALLADSDIALTWAAVSDGG